MKCLRAAILFGFVVEAGFGQGGTGTIAGVVSDAATGKPVPAAYVMAVAAGPGAGARGGSTKTGGGGEYEIRGLAAGTYSLCVQAQDQQYVDPCLWGGPPVQVTLSAGQAVAVPAVRVARAARWD
jgi:hypothetical protein